MQTRTVVRFIGGDRDGEIRDSADPADRREVDGCLWLTDNGKLGAAFGGMSEAGKEYLRLHGPEGSNPGFKPHVYKVTGRDESDDTLTLTLTFSGNDMQKP